MYRDVTHRNGRIYASCSLAVMTRSPASSPTGEPRRARLYEVSPPKTAIDGLPAPVQVDVNVLRRRSLRRGSRIGLRSPYQRLLDGGSAGS